MSASASVDGASAQGQLACQHQRFPVHLDHGDFRSLRLYDARRHVRAQQTTSAFASRTSRNSNDQLFHGSLPSGSTTRSAKNPSLNSSMPSFAAINNQMRSSFITAHFALDLSHKRLPLPKYKRRRRLRVGAWLRHATTSRLGIHRGRRLGIHRPWGGA